MIFELLLISLLQIYVHPWSDSQFIAETYIVFALSILILYSSWQTFQHLHVRSCDMQILHVLCVLCVRCSSCGIEVSLCCM